MLINKFLHLQAISMDDDDQESELSLHHVIGEAE